MWNLIPRQAMPLFVKTIRHSYTILPLFQSAPFAITTQCQRTQEIVTLSNIFIPNGEQQYLLVQIIWPRLERKLFVVYWIQRSPFDGWFEFLIFMWFWFDLSGRSKIECQKRNLGAVFRCHIQFDEGIRKSVFVHCHQVGASVDSNNQWSAFRVVTQCKQNLSILPWTRHCSFGTITVLDI